MSLHSILASLNSPYIVSAAGCTVLSGLSFAAPAIASAPLTILQCLNLGAYVINVACVSVPGRIDGEASDPNQKGKVYSNTYSPARGQTLVSPSGWAFSIWGPIFLGEAVFCAAQFFPSSGLGIILPQITPPFVAANLFQALWCAAFRPSYYRDEGLAVYVSPLLLAGTAYSLSQVQTALYVSSNVTATASWCLVPLIMHFGWTTAATLVNLNGSAAAVSQNGDKTVSIVGHLSAVLATSLGVGLTLLQASPVYGFTIAWALGACADGMNKRLATCDEKTSGLREAAELQRRLCLAGALACTSAAMFIKCM